MPYWLVTPMFNQSPNHFSGFQPGDSLIASEYGAGFNLENGILGAADFAFKYFNSDKRPNSHCERSLSVGDVVCIDDAEGVSRYFACERSGWREVTNEKFEIEVAA